MEERVTPPWAAELSENEFISYSITFPFAKYDNLFEKGFHENNQVGDMTYYFYNQIKHGYPANKKYPLLIFMHGASNSFGGEMCISYSGAGMYASPEYQKTMGGAYILVPLANEKRDENNKLIDGWALRYIEPVLSLLRRFTEENKENIGKKFVFGNSSGATFCQQLAEVAPEFFDGCIPVGSGYVISQESMRLFDKYGVNLFFAISKHDEFHDFTTEIGPHLDDLNNMKHAFLYFPEWTKNGDGGVSSAYYGVEMGQHCLMNTMQANLMLDDGTPLDSRLKEGMTGWIRSICEMSE